MCFDLRNIHTLFLINIIGSWTLFSSISFGHFLDGDGAQTLKYVKSLDELPASIQKMEDDTIVYSFLIPKIELIRHLPIDKNNDFSISPIEFDNNQPELDKWVRKHVSITSQGKGFFDYVFDISKPCILSKAQYGPFGYAVSEELYLGILSFNCPSQRSLKITNSLPQFYRSKVKVLLRKMRIEKKNGIVKWVWLQKDKKMLSIKPF